MPRACTICAHPERDVIDAALVAGEAFRRVAARYGVTEQAIRRHRKAHLPEALIKARQAEESARADNLLAQLRHPIRGSDSQAMPFLSPSKRNGSLGSAFRQACGSAGVRYLVYSYGARATWSVPATCSSAR